MPRTTVPRRLVWLTVALPLIAACGSELDATTDLDDTLEEVAAGTVTDNGIATDPPATEPPPPATEPDDDEPTVDDFTIDLIVTEDQCFDSAGALITVEPELYSDYEGTATVVYEIRGAGVSETFSLDVDGGSYTYDDHLISTERCNVTLTAEVVRVITR